MSEHPHVQYVRSVNVVRLQLGSDCELRGCIYIYTQMARDPVTVHCLVLHTDVPSFQYTSLVVVRMGESTTSASSQLISCIFSTACSATADWAVFPDVNALLCSFKRCSIVLPVWPMYTLEHEPHEIR